MALVLKTKVKTQPKFQWAATMEYTVKGKRGKGGEERRKFSCKILKDFQGLLLSSKEKSVREQCQNKVR